MTALCVSLFVLVSWFWWPMWLCHLVSALFNDHALRVELTRVKTQRKYKLLSDSQLVLVVTSLTDWLTVTDWLTDWLSDQLIDWLIGWLIDWLLACLLTCLVDWLIDWLIDWFFRLYCINDCTNHYGSHVSWSTTYVTSLDFWWILSQDCVSC